MKKKAGFTLVELSFSVVFIAILALMVVFVSLNMTNIFQRGMTVKEVNLVGNSLIDDFRSAISNSSAKNLKDICSINYNYTNSSDGSMIQKTKTQKACEDDDTYSFIYDVRMGEVKLGKDDTDTIDVPISGAFCTGVYTYVWNSGYFFNDNYEVVNAEPATLKYTGDIDGVQNIKHSDGDSMEIEAVPKNSKTTISDITIKGFKLLRIIDPSRQVCSSKIDEATNGNEIGYITNSDTKFTTHMQQFPNYDISGEKYSNIYGEVLDILATDVYSNLALYDLNVFRPAQSEKDRNIFFSGSFILASIDGTPNITASSNYCATPDDYEKEDFNYCSINKFNFAIQANGE